MILSDRSVVLSKFLITYLGLSLTTGQQKAFILQLMVDKIIRKMSSWKGKNLAPLGCLALVKGVMISQPIHFVLAIKTPVSILRQVDKARR